MVTVVHTDAPPPTCSGQDPGMTDWNVSFSTFVQGSALKRQVVTRTLA